MSLKDVNFVERRNGFGLAQEQASIVEVKWNAFTATCAAGIDNKTRFINSSGFWAHVAFVLADTNNASNVFFGPTAYAASRILAPGTEYEIPPVYPMLPNSWTVFDLGDWWFCSLDPAKITIMYV